MIKTSYWYRTKTRPYCSSCRVLVLRTQHIIVQLRADTKTHKHGHFDTTKQHVAFEMSLFSQWKTTQTFVLLQRHGKPNKLVQYFSFDSCKLIGCGTKCRGRYRGRICDV